MGNALNRITESEELTPSSSSSEVADRSRLSGLACVKRSRALRLGTISRGTSDVEEEARPRRRLFKLRRGYVAESIAASDSNDRVRNAIPLSSRSSSESSRVATQSQQDKRSQELDSIATAKTSPNPTAPSPTEHQISTTQLRNCTVCTEYLPPYRFPTRTPTTSCEHPPDTCRRCVRKWIRFSFLTRQWHHIDCPECDQRLQHEDLKAFADPELLGKYEALATKAAMEAIPGFRWCIGKRCDSGQVHEGEGTRFVCAKCKAEHCVMHDVPWHKKETCAEYEYRTRGRKKASQDRKTQKWLAKKTRKCPGCGWSIQKNGGCDHMRCSKCEMEFCFECLAPTVWDDIDIMIIHANDCSNAVP